MHSGPYKAAAAADVDYYVDDDGAGVYVYDDYRDDDADADDDSAVDVDDAGDADADVEGLLRPYEALYTALKTL